MSEAPLSCGRLSFLVLVVSLSVLIPRGQAQTPPVSHITAGELRKTLQSADTHRIVEAMNRVKRSQRSAELMSYVHQLWSGDGGAADVPQAVLDNPRIRIELANVLIQASNNGFIRFNRGDARTYSRQVARGSPKEARVTAILNLGLLDDARDVDLLKDIGLEEDSQTFRPAVIALARMCDPSAQNALADVRSRVRDQEHREFAHKPVEELAPFKRCPSRRG